MKNSSNKNSVLINENKNIIQNKALRSIEVRNNIFEKEQKCKDIKEPKPKFKKLKIESN